MPSVSNISRQRPLGMLVGVVLLLMTLAALAANQDWLQPPIASTAAAQSSDAEGALLTAVYNDDPAAIRQLAASDGMSLSPDAPELALITAVTMGHEKAVAELLRCGTAVNGTTVQGRTPLLLAAGTPGDFGIAQLLLRAGANPNAPSNLGETPLSEAKHIGDQELLKLLQSHSAKHDK
jgi:ankyrin repeat protein